MAKNKVAPFSGHGVRYIKFKVVQTNVLASWQTLLKFASTLL